MSEHESVIDEMLRDALRSGEFSNLPGEGKPLKLNDDPYTPEQLRVSHKLLKDNDLAPDWIMQGKDLDAEREQLLRNLRIAANRYQGELADARRSTAPEHGRLRAEAGWQAAQDELRALAQRYNKRVLSYNLKVPPGVAHKPLFNAEREAQKYA